MSSNVERTQADQVVVRKSRAGVLTASLLCLIVASPDIANAAPASVPTVDIATTCRESEKAITSIFGPGTLATFDSCMKQEQEAREQIVKNWMSFPAGGRQRCVNTTGYMPSYVEWLTCLEMEQSVEALRKSGPAATNPVGGSPATTEGQSDR
jgi:hypothetical protein